MARLIVSAIASFSINEVDVITLGVSVSDAALGLPVTELGDGDFTIDPVAGFTTDFAVRSVSESPPESGFYILRYAPTSNHFVPISTYVIGIQVVQTGTQRPPKPLLVDNGQAIVSLAAGVGLV